MLAVLYAMQPGGEEAVLRVQVGVAAGRGFDQGDTGVKVGFVVQRIDDPVDESAQEVAAAKLNDALGAARAITMLAVEVVGHVVILHSCVVCRWSTPSVPSYQRGGGARFFLDCYPPYVEPGLRLGNLPSPIDHGEGPGVG